MSTSANEMVRALIVKDIELLWVNKECCLAEIVHARVTNARIPGTASATHKQQKLEKQPFYVQAVLSAC